MPGAGAPPKFEALVAFTAKLAFAAFVASVAPTALSPG
jgi:hypothetical protein